MKLSLPLLVSFSFPPQAIKYSILAMSFLFCIFILSFFYICEFRSYLSFWYMFDWISEYFSFELSYSICSLYCSIYYLVPSSVSSAGLGQEQFWQFYSKDLFNRIIIFYCSSLFLLRCWISCSQETKHSYFYLRTCEKWLMMEFFSEITSLKLSIFLKR